LGILYPQAKMLLDASKAGLPMDKVLTIGRQALFLHHSELRQIRKTCLGALPNYRWGEYSDRFIAECLHAREIHSLDFSSYEGADVLHDLNKPIPDSWYGNHDVVIEAGTLEHIFNFPIAVANLMKMTKVGGTMFVSMIANNLCGHGFYQFSPELVFRVFSPENGFRIGKVFAAEAEYPGVELTAASNLFEVVDPAQVRERVGLLTRRPVMLFFDTVKIADGPLFSASPIQSDYSAAWREAGRTEVSTTRRWLKRIPGYSSSRSWLANSRIFRTFRRRLIGRRQEKQFSLRNKRFFKKP
jgi:hypothetical protein